jgi:nucleoside-diphosphate-sugar epimerase
MTVSILGCGWLGLPLAVELIKSGNLVKGTTTSESKIELFKKNGIKPYLLDINSDKTNKPTSDFFVCDILIFSIPPKRHFKDVISSFLQISEFVKNKIEKNKIGKLIFISSTSVYPLNNGIVTEKNTKPDKPSGKALVKAEDLFLNIKNLKTTIIRFGGLIGYERSALTLLKKKKEINNASSPLNLIHRDDCVEIIKKVIEKDSWGYVFNACADEHPKRKDFYLNACKKNNLPIPLFKDDEKGYKIVSSELLKSTLNYTFKYPNPLNIEHE